MKPGYKTTEFWLHTIAIVLGLVMSSGAMSDGPLLQIVGAIVTVLGAAGYGVNRAVTKSSEVKAQAFIEAARAGIGTSPTPLTVASPEPVPVIAALPTPGRSSKP